MAKYVIDDSTLTSIADPVRTLMGLTGGLTPANMKTQLDGANTAVADALAALKEKGVDTTGKGLADLAALIAAIEGGGGKITSGWFYPASSYTITTEKPYSIAHGLGVTPSFAIVFRGKPTTEDLFWLGVYATAIADGWSKIEAQMSISTPNYGSSSTVTRPKGVSFASDVGVSVDSTNINIYTENTLITPAYYCWIAGVI